MLNETLERVVSFPGMKMYIIESEILRHSNQKEYSALGFQFKYLKLVAHC